MEAAEVEVEEDRLWVKRFLVGDLEGDLAGSLMEKEVRGEELGLFGSNSSLEDSLGIESNLFFLLFLFLSLAFSNSFSLSLSFLKR